MPAEWHRLCLQVGYVNSQMYIEVYENNLVVFTHWYAREPLKNKFEADLPSKPIDTEGKKANWQTW